MWLYGSLLLPTVGGLGLFLPFQSGNFRERINSRHTLMKMNAGPEYHHLRLASHILASPVILLFWHFSVHI
jgi:hypothetical protein